jgi:hypothetical protein
MVNKMAIKTILTLDVIADLLERHGEFVRFTSKVYGEDSSEVEAYIFANWNNVPSYLQSWLEKRGFVLLWDDEYVFDYSQDTAYRCIPTHYGWTPDYICNDWTNGEVIGRDDLIDIADEYIDECLLNDPTQANQLLGDDVLEKHGFVRLETGENGFHAHQTDDPSMMLKEAQTTHPNADFVFSIDRTGQFDVHFSLWMRENNS